MLTLWRCACGREQPDTEERCLECEWVGRAGCDWVVGVLCNVKPVEDGRCLSCGEPESIAGCHVVDVGGPWIGGPLMLGVYCRPTIERMREDAIMHPFDDAR